MRRPSWDTTCPWAASDPRGESLFLSKKMSLFLKLLFLGGMYCTGYVVEQDAEKGIQYLKKAALLGNTMAQINLGRPSS